MPKRLYEHIKLAWLVDVSFTMFTLYDVFITKTAELNKHDKDINERLKTVHVYHVYVEQNRYSKVQ